MSNIPKITSLAEAMDWLIENDEKNEIFDISTGTWREPYLSEVTRKYYAKARVLGVEVKDEEIIMMVQQVVELHQKIKEGTYVRLYSDADTGGDGAGETAEASEKNDPT